MTLAKEIATYADTLLETGNTPDYANALNGLQLDSLGVVEKLAAAVDFSTASIQGAIAAKANFLIVHHGMFWNGLEHLSGASRRRLQLLFEHDIAVYSSHLPLDRHPSVGNNVLLAEELGLSPSRPFAMHGGVAIGCAGEENVETHDLAERTRQFAESCGGSLRTTVIKQGQTTRRWGICTGAGASTDILNEALAAGIDTLIVGEGPHWTAIFAAEHELTIFYAGHYATETLGVRALAKHLSEKFGIPWTFVGEPTGL